VPTRKEIEVRRRILVSAAAFAYEFDNDPIMSDEEFDALSRAICPAIATGDKEMDAFFRKHFSPDTGMWVHRLPKARLARLERVYRKYLHNDIRKASLEW